MCEECKRENLEDLKDVKGFHKIQKPLGNKPYEDISGQKFGRLTAIRAVGRNKKGAVLWLCECECSNKLITLVYSLKKGETKSCKCLTSDRMKKFDDLTGRVFGRLTVVRRVENKGNKIYYECLCSCGNTVVVRGSHLKQGLIQSCKCLNRERTHEAHFEDLTGQKIGRLFIKGIERREKVKDGYDTFDKAVCEC